MGGTRLLKQREAEVENLNDSEVPIHDNVAGLNVAVYDPSRVSGCECGGNPNFQGISLSLTASDETDAERLFAALAEGGKVTLPLTKTFFSPRFGMIADRFGVSWMVQAPPQKQK